MCGTAQITILRLPVTGEQLVFVSNIYILNIKLIWKFVHKTIKKYS